MSTKTPPQYTVQMLSLQLALMQTQQCLFLLIYLDHLQSQQLFPRDRTGKKPPRATRWTRRVRGSAPTGQRREWQSERGAAGPSWGYRPTLPLRFPQELEIPGGSAKPSLRKLSCTSPHRENETDQHTTRMPTNLMNPKPLPLLIKTSPGSPYLANSLLKSSSVISAGKFPTNNRQRCVYVFSPGRLSRERFALNPYKESDQFELSLSATNTIAGSPEDPRRTQTATPGPPGHCERIQTAAPWHREETQTAAAAPPGAPRGNPNHSPEQRDGTQTAAPGPP